MKKLLLILLPLVLVCLGGCKHKLYNCEDGLGTIDFTPDVYFISGVAMCDLDGKQYKATDVTKFYDFDTPID